MRRSILGALTIATAACMASCVDEKNTPKPNPSSEKIEVVVSLDQPQNKVRGLGSAAQKDDAVEIMEGCLVFFDFSDHVTALYPMKRTAADQPLTVDGGTVNGDGTISLSGVPGATVSMWVLANYGTAIKAPFVGESSNTASNRYSAAVDLSMVREHKHVPSTGSAPLADNGAGKKKATVTLTSVAARVQIATISTKDVECNIEGIYLNRLNTKVVSGWMENGSNADYFADGTDQYPTAMRGLTHDHPGKRLNTGSKTDPKDGIYGYGLIRTGGLGNEMPQIILKLTDVKAYSPDLQSNSDLPGPQFLTITRFKDKDNNIISEMQSGMIYTIDNIEISAARLTPRPNLRPVDVTVTIVPMTWGETPITPEY